MVGEYGYYTGTCPPGSARAPAFTATFTVDRTPALVSYRGVADNGSVTDKQWRTLTFAEGDVKSQSKVLDFSTYYEDESVRTLIGGEVRDPTETRSNKVPLIIVCKEAGDAEG